MFVRIAPGETEVEEPDDLTRLSVVTRLDAEDLRTELRRAGLGDVTAGGFVQLNVTALHKLAAARSTVSNWQDGWSAMLTYAVDKGWMSVDGRTVRVHVERA